MLESVSNVSYELDLKWDHSSDDEDTLARNVRIRQEAIDELCSFLRHLPFADQRRIRLDHIRSDEFELSWYTYIYDVLNRMARRMLLIVAGRLTDSASVAVEKKTHTAVNDSEPTIVNSVAQHLAYWYRRVLFCFST